MAYRRRKTDEEEQQIYCAACEIVADFGLTPGHFEVMTWIDVQKQFKARAVWIRNCWNVAAAVKWLREQMISAGLKERDHRET